jgi:hypothetical protein
MLTSHATAEDPAGGAGPVITEGYGYAWCAGTVSGLRVFFHTGGNAGFRSPNGWIPDLTARVIVLFE